MTDERRRSSASKPSGSTPGSKPYKGVDAAYIVHDAVAHEVDEHTFYHTRGSSTRSKTRPMIWQTRSLTPLLPCPMERLCFSVFEQRSSSNDIPHCVELLTQQLLPKVNLFGYGQVESPYGSGEFFDYVNELTGEHENVVTSKVPDREAILGSIKEFLSTGR